MWNGLSKQVVEALLRSAEVVDINTADLRVYVEAERVPFSVYWKVWQVLEARCSGSGTWLTMAQHVDHGGFGILEYYLRNCATVGDALRELCRGLIIVYGGVRIQLRVVGERARLSFCDARAPRAATEWAVAVLFHVLEDIVGHPFIERVRFQHGGGTSGREYVEYFGCPVSFDETETTLEFGRRILGESISGADPNLRRVLETSFFMEQRNISEGPQLTFVERVREQIEESFREGRPSAGQVAANLGMSTSTLQRRLKGSGLQSFGSYVEQIRLEIARALLRRDDLTVKEIAMRLGFADPSNFVRSFRRAMDTTPGEYRRRKLAA